MSEIELQRQINHLQDRIAELERKEYSPIACRVYNNAVFTVGDSAWAAITFNSERNDTSGMHSISVNTSRITFALGGWYLCGGHVYWTANATGVRELGIRQGGSTFLGVTGGVNLGAVISAMQTVVILHYFSTTEYVELCGWQNSGGNLDILSGSSYSPEFWAIRIP